MEVPQVMISRMITAPHLRDAVTWFIDITGEEDVEGQVGYLSKIPPFKMRKNAHKLHCSSKYGTETGRRKAMRRLIRGMLRLCPELLAEAFEMGVWLTSPEETGLRDPWDNCLLWKTLAKSNQS